MFIQIVVLFFFFFFNDTATTEIYTLSLHDALPISRTAREYPTVAACGDTAGTTARDRKSTRLNSSHVEISYAVFCLKKKSIRRRRPGAGLPPGEEVRRPESPVEGGRVPEGLRRRIRRPPEDPVRGPRRFFFFNDTAPTEIYTLSLHDALPITVNVVPSHLKPPRLWAVFSLAAPRSEEHTSELQSRRELVCRLLLETNKQT